MSLYFVHKVLHLENTCQIIVTKNDDHKKDFSFSYHHLIFLCFLFDFHPPRSIFVLKITDL